MTDSAKYEAFLEIYFGEFLETNPIPIARLGEDGAIINCNHPFRRLTQRLTNAQNTWTLYDDIKPECHPILEKLLSDAFAGNCTSKPVSLELKGADSDSEARTTVSLYITCLQPSGVEKHMIIVHLIDNTEQKNLEMRFAHSQKMQAVGQLAGGVAHDFNNLLTAMIGFCDLLLMRHPAGDPSFADIMQIKQNANRAANLVRQLLAFSRRQTLQPKVLDITDVLAELSHLIRRLIGENIVLNMQHGRDMGMIKVDQGQLEQVIINLAVNARDAMSGGGTLTIKTSDVSIDANNRPNRNMISPAAEDSITDGEYVLVEVQDTGCGIPRQLIQQIFEPFFSTKEVGSGTGLGLSTVYGIVKQTGGYIYVTSQADDGTTFSIYFPRYESNTSVRGESQEKLVAADLTGSGTILLVEDESPVRMFAARALSNKGYKVIEADSAETALETIDQHGDEIQIIITDVIMPGMTGPDMVVKILETYPDIKVIFISGYAEDAFVNSYGSEREFNFLPKPFTLKQLATKVKDVLEDEN
ncbi:MAG: ATP-binding protein [Alphaproteobacteria bacterium]|nr:ATP-binding protein [Alphaproteobacteria bacterium]